MKVVLGCDHAGFVLKQAILEHLKQADFFYIDVGAFDQTASDYPQYASLACEKIRNGEAERGILICGSGIGMCVAANKYKNIRASVCHDVYSARQAVEHDHLNVLCLGSRVIQSDLAFLLVDAFLSAKPSQEERFLRRLKQIAQIEVKQSR